MLGGFSQGSDRRYADPEEVLAGKCMSCGTVVRCLRKDVAYAKGLGSWSDLLGTECPQCRARVFVMPIQDFKRVMT